MLHHAGTGTGRQAATVAAVTVGGSGRHRGARPGSRPTTRRSRRRGSSKGRRWRCRAPRKYWNCRSGCCSNVSDEALRRRRGRSGRRRSTWLRAPRAGGTLDRVGGELAERDGDRGRPRSSRWSWAQPMPEPAGELVVVAGELPGGARLDRGSPSGAARWRRAPGRAYAAWRGSTASSASPGGCRGVRRRAAGRDEACSRTTSSVSRSFARAYRSLICSTSTCRSAGVNGRPMRRSSGDSTAVTTSAVAGGAGGSPSPSVGGITVSSGRSGRCSRSRTPFLGVDVAEVEGRRASGSKAWWRAGRRPPTGSRHRQPGRRDGQGHRS